MTEERDTDAAPSAKQPATMGRKAFWVSAPIMLSRVLAVVREQMLAALLGSTAAGEAFQLAFRIPNLARDLFAEGALSSAFVPTFTDYAKNKSREAAFRLANALIGLVLTVVGSVAVLGIIFTPEIVHAISEFDDPETTSMAIHVTPILFPFLPIVSLAAVCMGQLNAQEKFTAPALAPAVFNVVAIITGTILLLSDQPPESAFIWWSVGVLIGGLCQLLVQVPVLLKTGFRFWPRLDFKEPGMRRILWLMTPAVIGVAAMNVNVLVNTFFATQQPGAIVWLDKAFRLVYLPIGVFAIAIATISTTRLAQRAAEKDIPGLRKTLEEGLRLVAFLALPSTVGLIALREPIVRLLFEYGEFVAPDTAATASALFFYTLGLYAYSAVKVLAPSFYALNHPRAPLIASLCAVALNIALNIILFPIYGFEGLAFGTAAAATINLIVLTIAFRQLVGGLSVAPLAGHAARVVVAAAACGAVSFYAHEMLSAALGTASALSRVAGVAGSVAVGAAVYMAGCRLLGIAELGQFLGVFRRRG